METDDLIHLRNAIFVRLNQMSNLILQVPARGDDEQEQLLSRTLAGVAGLKADLEAMLALIREGR